MKKFTVIMLVLAAVLCAFVGCSKGNTTTGTGTSTLAQTKTVEEKSLSTAEILELAKKETGAFYAYGNTSRIATAMQGFVDKYGAQLGLTKENAVGSKMKDSEIYTTLNQEAQGSSSKVASVVMIQDSAQLLTYKQSTDILVNYVPAAMKGVLSAEEQDPLLHQYINKLFIWNNVGTDGEAVITNVWELTEAKWKDKVFFKDPNSELVNMNFLIMCTSDAWAFKLATAYKHYYGKDVELGSYKNAGYKWVAEFLNNCNFSISSDTTMAKEMAKAESKGCIGLFVLSKFRDVDETIKGNLSVGAWQQKGVEPFAGFMYPMYVQITKKSNRPYTAMLFVDYLMTEEGFGPWGSEIGAYSADPSIPVNADDSPLTFWKDCLVAEDAQYVFENKIAVQDFINKVLATKKK